MKNKLDDRFGKKKKNKEKQKFKMEVSSGEKTTFLQVKKSIEKQDARKRQRNSEQPVGNKTQNKGQFLCWSLSSTCVFSVCGFSC